MSSIDSEYQKLNNLLAVSEELILANDVGEIGEIAVDYFERCFTKPAGFWEYDGKNEQLSPVTQNKLSNKIIAVQPAFEEGNSIAWEFFIKNKLKAFDDIQNSDSIHNPNTSLRTEVFIPIDSYGLVITGSQTVGDFSDLDLKILQLFQNILISAMQRVCREENVQISQDVYDRVFRHNIRNRINVIQGFAKNLKREDIDESIDQEIQRIIDASEQLQQTARGIETLQEVIQSPDDTYRIDIVPHIEKTIAKLKDESEFECERDLPNTLTVHCHTKIGAAFYELFSNCIIHNPNQTPYLSVSVEEHDRYSSIVIEDDGPGIPETELETLRERRETPLAHASGIGLWVADRVVSNSGGTLMFDVTDAGTTVEIVLPYS